MGECRDLHLDYVGEQCPECGLDVDNYGNTEVDFAAYCSFPDCGCDGARLCMAGEASERALDENVEGMWLGRTLECKAAQLKLYRSVLRNKELGDG